MNKKEAIKNAAKELVLNFLTYDRKYDEDLPPGVIEVSIKNNEITIDEIANAFKSELVKELS